MRKLCQFLFALLLLALAAVTPAQALGGLNEFTIEDYQIDYYLERDHDGHSMLRTVESISARFPSYDQNHGIERAIPASYDGHTVDLRIGAVTNAESQKWNYTTYESNGNTVVRIGDADRYVHGLQTYNISYTQKDVTKYFKNTNDDEFYWDTNGTEWKAPISSLTVRIHLGSGLADKLNGARSCYAGIAGATTACQFTKIDDGFAVQADALSAGENVTVALGFKPQTFAEHTFTIIERYRALLPIIRVVTYVLTPVLMLIAWSMYRRASNRTGEHKTVIAEYIPPKDTSVTVSGSVWGKSVSTFTAQIVDLAVRGYLKIYQTTEKTWFRQPEFEIEITKDISDLKDEEKEIITDIFPSTDIGTRLNLKDLKKNNLAIALKVSDNQKKLDTLVRRTYGLRAKVPAASKRLYKFGIITAALVIIAWTPAPFIPAVFAVLLGFSLWPLTDKGLALYQYLEGLKLYTKVAETERIKMLQSPAGAEKLDEPVNVHDTRQLVKLYERVLPYAILFGLEKEWNKQLGAYYESTHESPAWFHGTSPTFNSLAFGNAISSFNTAASYSSASSSTGGGSSGGGSSGGGGGGGGGGGW